MLAVIVPTLGRPGVVAGLLTRLRRQTRPADEIVLAVTGEEDLPADPAGAAGRPVTVLRGPAGSSTQRNQALDHLFDRGFGEAGDVAVFLDDDFVMREDWLSMAEAELGAKPDLAGLTGVVLADGAPLAGYGELEAERLVAEGRALLPAGDWRLSPGATAALYGCNMAVRGSCLDGLRFDGGLPLYAWLEDHDFSARLRVRGGLLRSSALVGVHMGVKLGRSSGRRLGYSQIANAVYLWRKGTLSSREMRTMVFKNGVANLLKSARPEPFIDRRGRLLGNLDAAWDALRGRLRPDRIRGSAGGQGR